MFNKLKNYEMSKRIIYVLAYLIFALLPIVLIVSIVTGDVSALSQYVIGVFGTAFRSHVRSYQMLLLPHRRVSRRSRQS